MEIAQYKKEFKELINQVTRPGIDSLTEYISTKTDFFTAPASSFYHCNYDGGLLVHSMNVYKRLKKLISIDKCYNDQYSEETLIIVALFHDLCKANYYKVDYRNQKNEAGMWQKVPYYKHDEAFPVPHSQKSIIILQRYINLTDEEILAINAHMGGFDKNSDCVSASFERSPLAVLLHVADLEATYLDESKQG